MDFWGKHCNVFFLTDRTRGINRKFLFLAYFIEEKSFQIQIFFTEIKLSSCIFKNLDS